MLGEIKKKIIWRIRKFRLKNKTFTIISDNCWGGFIYKNLDLKFNTPFIGLFIFSEDYINLLKNLDNIIYKKLEFIDPNESKYKLELKNNGTLGKYPIGILNKDVEIHFLHYKNEDEAREKWEKRVKRINKDNLLIKFCDRDCCTEELIEEFDKLNYKNKICFTAKDYPKLNSTILFEEFNGEECVSNEWNFYDKYIDIIKVLNNLKSNKN